jgi:heme-degrading monooxygenase HmoA
VHVILWAFEPKAGKEREFERTYGPGGDWAWLFARSPEYRGTELLRPTTERRYLTIDRWTSVAAYDAFRERWQTEYQALDKRCEALTERETLIGWFDSV